MNTECSEAGHVLVGLESQYFLLAQSVPPVPQTPPPSCLSGPAACLPCAGSWHIWLSAWCLLPPLPCSWCVPQVLLSFLGEKRQKDGDTCPGVIRHTGSGVYVKKELTLGKNFHIFVRMVTRGHRDQLTQLTQDLWLAVLKPGWYQEKEDVVPPAETTGALGSLWEDSSAAPEFRAPREFPCVFTLHQREGKAEAELVHAHLPCEFCKCLGFVQHGLQNLPGTWTNSLKDTPVVSCPETWLPSVRCGQG